MARAFEAVDDETVVSLQHSQQPGRPTADPTATAEQHWAAMATLKLLLATISQKTLVALSNLVTAGAVGSAWWLWDSVLPEPTTHQLVGVSLYAAFILAVEYLRRK